MSRKIIVFIINKYQKYLSLDTGYLGRLTNKRTCRMHPTCSEYTKICVIKHGSLKGIYLGAKRIIRCNPFNPNTYDLPPDNFNF